MTNLDSVLKIKDITLPTKVCIVKSMVFPVVMYRCESWTIKKAECWITDAFELVLEKILESPLDSKEIKPVNPKEINSEYSLERLKLKLKLLCFGHQIQRADSLEKTGAGKDWRQKEKRVAEDEMVGWHHWFNGHELGRILGDGEGQGRLACCSPWGKSRTQLTTEQQQWLPRVSAITSVFNSVITFVLIGHVTVNNVPKRVKIKHQHSEHNWIDDQTEADAISWCRRPISVFRKDELVVWETQCSLWTWLLLLGIDSAHKVFFYIVIWFLYAKFWSCTKISRFMASWKARRSATESTSCSNKQLVFSSRAPSNTKGSQSWTRLSDSTTMYKIMFTSF